MPEVTTRARDDVAVAAIQDILKQEDYNPKFLRDLIKACQTANQTLPSPEAIIINGKPYPVRAIREHLAKFVYMLPPEKRPAFDDDSLYNDSFLNRLSGIIDQVSGFAPEPPPANIPPNLKELTQIYQSAIEAKAKRENLTKPQIDEYIAKQITPVIIQTGVVKQAAKIQFEFVIDNSQYLENLAASLGRKPEVVRRLAKMRLDQIIDKTITTQALIQARSISVDTSQLTSMFVRNLQKGFDFDDLVGPAIRTNRQNAKKAIESIKKTVADETTKAQPAIEAAAENLENYPSVQKAARRDAQEAVKQVKPDIPPAKAARLNQQLVHHQDNPSVQEKIITNVFGVSAAQAKIIRGQLAPPINQLAKSSVRPNYLAMADPDSIFNDISLHPDRFPRPLVDAVRSGRINDPGKLADAIIISRTLNVPLEAVVLSQWGFNAQKLSGRWQQGPKFLWIIPMGHGVDPKDPDVIKLTGKLTRLVPAQKQLTDSLKTPPPLLPPQIPQQFQKTAGQNSRAVRFSEFFDQINIFRIPSAVSFNLSRLPPFRAIDNAVAPFVSGLRIKSPAVNFIFNAYNAFTGGIPQIPSVVTSFVTTPFRAVGSAISNTIINPVKTWAGTQIKSGLARAGAWLAKKGITEGAKKVGMALVGKGTAALLAQAVPVAGQIFAAALIGGDILKFLWNHKDEVGMFLGGMFLWGQMMLGSLIHFISSLGTLGLTTGIGAFLGTIFIPIPFVGTAIGAAAGFSLGLAINAAGGLGAALSGLGTALGSAAASFGSFLGALTAPSLVAGIPATAALIVPTVITGAIIYQTILSPDFKIFPALFVPPEETLLTGAFPPGEIVECTTDQKPLQFTNNATSSIASRGWEIVNNLYQGFWCYWNKSPEYPEIFNEEFFLQDPNPCYVNCEATGRRRPTGYDLFWCTWLIVKAYNETGTPFDIILGAQRMAEDFQARGKYIFASETTYLNIAPGDAMFFDVEPEDGNDWIGHVALVYQVTLDFILTLDSNASTKTHTYTVATDGKIQDLPGFRIMGFGKP